MIRRQHYDPLLTNRLDALSDRTGVDERKFKKVERVRASSMLVMAWSRRKVGFAKIY